MKGMQLFDNYEEDGQLSLFSADYDDWDDDWEETPEESAVKAEEEEPEGQKDDVVPDEASDKTGSKTEKAKSGSTAKARVTAGSTPEPKTGTIGAAVDTYEKAVASLEITNAGPTVRVKYCASCGKLLFVREETAGFHSECNNCGIKYFQKLG